MSGRKEEVVQPYRRLCYPKSPNRAQIKFTKTKASSEILVRLCIAEIRLTRTVVKGLLKLPLVVRKQRGIYAMHRA
jgi:hypothetical protein